MSAPPHLVGLISDTHGLVRPRVHEALAGVSIILHAGDVGTPEVIQELELIAPVLAVYGNTDAPELGLPGVVVYNARGRAVHVSHGHELGSPTPDRLLASYAEPILVYGHTHRPLIVRAAERIVVNPGAAGPRRFDVVPTVGVLRVTEAGVDVEILDLS